MNFFPLAAENINLLSGLPGYGVKALREKHGGAMVMKRGCLFLCGLALLLLPGCGKRETRIEAGNHGQILHLGNGSEPQDLDPHIVTGVPEHRLIMALLEGLVSEDPVDLHPVPGVAQSWDISPDATVYTFHLRRDARWSNGDPVTAKDFWESYRRVLTPSLASEYAYMLFVVRNAAAYNRGEMTDFSRVGFKVVDDYTFEITLENATPYFLSLMNHNSWFPVHLPTLKKYGDPYQRGNKWTRPRRFVGNGAFVLDQWRVNDVVVVKKSPTYWDRGRVRLQEIWFYPIESADTEERAFRGGQLHVTATAPLSKIDAYKAKAPDLIGISPYLGTYFYRVNVTRPPLNERRIRRALALALDRESLVRNVTKGGQLPAYSFTPPGTGDYTPRAAIGGDLQEARRLLAEAGYPGGKGLPPIELLYNTLEAHRTIAEAIQQMWEKNLGIAVRLVNQEWKVYLDAQRTLDYEICRAGWIGDYVDPNSFLDMWLTGGGNNNTGWSNAEYDRLIAQAGRTTDPQQRLEIFQKAEAILLQELPIIPIYYYTRVNLKRPEVQGWYPTILDHHPYKYVYLDSGAE